MNVDSAIASLEGEWDIDSGFFGRVRQGSFDPASLDRLERILGGIDSYRDAAVNGRLVSLLWYMPLVMQWNRERILDAGGDINEFDKAANRVVSAAERILGVP